MHQAPSCVTTFAVVVGDKTSIAFGIPMAQPSAATAVTSCQAGFTISVATRSDARAVTVSSSCAPA